jgi:uncharacterized membrane protein
MTEHATTLTHVPQSHALEDHSNGRQQVNVGDVERWLSVIGGGALVLYGLRRSLGHLALMLGGSALVYRGLTGYCGFYQALGVSTAQRDRSSGRTLEATVTVNKPAAEVYRFWRRLENHPRFMKHLESVVSMGNQRSHWVARVPMQGSIEWDAEVVEERENALLSWRSLPGAEVANAGTVRFRELPNNRGTEVRLRMEYAPPGGIVGAALGRLLSTLSVWQLKEDLRRFRQLVEAGETATINDQPSGRAVAH